MNGEVKTDDEYRIRYWMERARIAEYFASMNGRLVNRLQKKLGKRRIEGCVRGATANCK
jgi:hypothetical protein